MHVFPNPISTSQMLNVELDAELQGQVSLQLISLSGQVVFENSYYKFSGEQQKKISLQGLARGTYLLTLQCGEKTGTQKILIQ